MSNEKSKMINRKPDWICDYCYRFNSADNVTCVSCGAPRVKESLDYFEVKQEQREKEEMLKKQERNVMNEIEENKSRPKYKMSGFKFEKLRSFFIAILISVSLIAFFAFLICLFIPKEKEATVDSFEWKYKIEIQKYETVDESDWQLPSGARLKYTSEEIYDYDKVVDYYETKT